MRDLEAALRLRVLLVFAAAVGTLAIGAAATWSWANHVEIQPWSLALACQGVDSFLCHDDASRALAELRQEAPHVRSSLPMEMSDVIVSRTDPYYPCSARKMSCPAGLLDRLRQIAHRERVTVRYSLVGSSSAGDVIDIVTLHDGHVQIQVLRPIQFRVPI